MPDVVRALGGDDAGGRVDLIPLVERLVVGEDRAAVAVAAERLGREEAGRGDRSLAPYRSPAVGGAEALGARRGTAERDRIPVDDDWDVPKQSRAWT